MPTETEIESLRQVLARKNSSDWSLPPEPSSFDSRASTGNFSGRNSDLGLGRISLPLGSKLIGILDTYTVLKELGGASGNYRARRDRDERTVFAKAYNLGSDNLRTFWHPREVEAITALAPQGITAPLLDTGDGEPLIVQPFIEGQDLDKIIRKGAHDADSIRKIALPILAKLDAAHRLGWINQDLKPENIRYRTSDKRHGEPLLNDWGLAYNRTLHPKDKHNLGTPLYQSPEQMFKPAHADERSDLYSFGIILYELLTGRNPRKQFTDRAEMARHAKLPYNPRETRESADERLSWITIKATQPDPSRRYQSALEFIEDLKRQTMVAVGEGR